MEQKILNKIKEKNNGITLIALVITIIVLLILAGVSIATLTGQNGILTQAQTAKENTELASEKEGIELAAQSSMTKNPDTLEITKINLDEGIREQLGNNREFETTDNKDGSFLVNLKNPDRMYYVDETGKVIPEENMLKISTADELKAFRNDVNSGNTYEGCYVYLTNDIELDINEEWEPIGIYVDSGLNPNTKPFKGIFNGNFNKISNLKISESTYQSQGLFGFARNNAKIMNIGLDNTCIITAAAVKQGSIVGFIYDGAVVSNCYNMSNIGNISNTHAGGVVGTASLNCEVKNCYNNGEVLGKGEAIGGIVGDVVLSSKVINCYNTGKIICEKGGGITGDLTGESSLLNCYNIGIIESNFIEYAGIISYTGKSQNNKIENNYYLENIINGTSNDRIIVEGIEHKTSEELKSMTLTLGEAFKEDTNNINNGYPILSWQ